MNKVFIGLVITSLSSFAFATPGLGYTPLKMTNAEAKKLYKSLNVPEDSDTVVLFKHIGPLECSVEIIKSVAKPHTPPHLIGINENSYECVIDDSALAE